MTDSIRLEGVTFGYPGKTVFTDLTLSIPDRQFCVLVGPNGGGKTTLLKLLLGFTTPQSGVVSVYEEPPAAASRLATSRRTSQPPPPCPSPCRPSS